MVKIKRICILKAFVKYVVCCVHVCVCVCVCLFDFVASNYADLLSREDCSESSHRVQCKAEKSPIKKVFSGKYQLG